MRNRTLIRRPARTRAFVLFSALLGIYGLAPASAAVFLVNSTSDVVDADLNDGLCKTATDECTLRAAIQQANALPGPDTINLPSGTYALALTTAIDEASGFPLPENEAASGDLDVRDAVTIQGDSADETFIDGLTKNRIFDIYSEPPGAMAVTLRKFSLVQGTLTEPTKNGGAIISDAYLRLENVTLRDNRASGGTGGAIHNLGGRLEIVNSLLSANSAGDAGGAIFNIGELSIANSQIDSSTAKYGAGVFLSRGTAFMDNVAIINNASDKHGGGLHIGGHTERGEMLLATMVMSNSRIEGNLVRQRDTGTRGGGAFVTAGSLVYLIDSVVANNDAAGQCSQCAIDGGGIANEIGFIFAQRSQFVSNTSSRWGGAIFNGVGQQLVITDCVFRNNAVTGGPIQGIPLSGGLGGAIASETGSDAKISNSLIVGNTAYHGSAISGSATLENVTIAGNTANGGGALFVPADNFSLNLNHVTLARNITTDTGANIHNPAVGAVKIKNSIVAEPGNTENCMGVIESLGNNVFSDESCVAETAVGDVLGDPLLAPLENDELSTAVALPGPAGPAIGIVPEGDCLSIDQRYFLRTGSDCDAGAANSGNIAGNFGEIEFSETAISANEADGSVTLTLKRSKGGDGPVRVEYIIFDETTSANDDYSTSLRGAVHWDDADFTDKTISVSVVDDAISENDETFALRLVATHGGATIGANRDVSVTINDNDISASPTFASGDGGGGSEVAILIFLIPVALRFSARLRQRALQK